VRRELHAGFCGEIWGERDYLEELGVDGRTWARLIRLKIRTVFGLLLRR
jgi:hypothetical protein